MEDFEKSILEKFNFINKTKVVGEIHQLKVQMSLTDEEMILSLIK